MSNEWIGKAIDVGGEVLKGAAAGSAVMPGIGTIIGAVALPAAKLAGQLLPGIAQEFARPEVANAAQEVVKAVTGNPNAQVSDLSSDQIDDLRIQLAQIAQQAQEVRENAYIEEIKAAAADRADARKTTVDMVKEHSAMSWGAPIVTAAVLGMTALFYYLMLTHAIEAGISARIEATLDTLCTAVVFFWVGSNNESRNKTNIIANSIPVSAIQKPPVSE